MEKNCKYNCVKGYCLSWNAGFDEIKCTEIDSLASPTPSFEHVVGEPKEESTPDFEAKFENMIKVADKMSENFHSLAGEYWELRHKNKALESELNNLREENERLRR
jgi:hypothetical protein